MSTTTISRIPRYQPRQTHAHGVTTERTISTLNIEEAGPLQTKSEFAQSSLVSAPGDVQPRAVSPAYSAEWHARSYSDVLMARMPPMPGALGETPACPTNETAETPSEDEGRTGKLVSAQVVTPVSRDAENTERKISFKFETLGDQVSLSKERTEDACDGRYGNWITASKKHAAGANGVTCKREQNTDLTQEQENLVRRAETRLTESKRSRMENRKDILSHPASNDRNSESHEVGLSKDKGKAPDPRNWGNANLADEDIETIADLAGSNEVPSVEHHHVFFRDMDLSEVSFKTPARQENPSSPSTRQSSRPMLNTNSAPAPLLRPLGNGCFVIPDRYRPNVTLLLTLDQIYLYLQHDADLRGGAAPRSIPSPAGYDEFAVALNTNAGNGIKVAFIPEGEASVRITGRPPALVELVGLETTQRTLPASRDPREAAGGKWLDPRRSELMEEVLWDNFERIRKQRQWRERGFSERQAKRRKRAGEKAVKPFAPSVAGTNAIAGPSSSSNPVPAYHSTPRAPSSPPPSCRRLQKKRMRRWRSPQRQPPKRVLPKPRAASQRNERPLDNV